MWSFDPDIRRGLATLKQLTARRHQTPVKEWPLVFVQELSMLLVVREWPDGELTAYVYSDDPCASRGQDGSEAA